MKKILITGANSYIGTSFQKWAETHYPDQLSADAIDMKDESWKQVDFGAYDIVFHVAGLTHADTRRSGEEVKRKYYSVNTDLAIAAAGKAKKEGVKQFVFLSSALIYGDSASYGKTKRITKDTLPQPASFYGDSKWKADQGVRALSDDTFRVTVVRAPMVFGKGSKGNYPQLAKMAKKLPVFPNVRNERSMLYIDNLCEFLCQVLLRGQAGIFWPQNKEYSCTSEMVRMIAQAAGHRIWISHVWNWTVRLAAHIPGRISELADKAFGNLSYEQSLSRYDFEYIVSDLRSAVGKTEAPD